MTLASGNFSIGADTCEFGADAGNFLVGAMDEISAAALQAGSVVATVPAYADALTLFPSGDAGADFVDDAGDFVTGRAGIGDAGEETVLDELLAEADAASLDQMRTWPAGIWGISRSCNSKSAPGLGTTAIFIFGMTHLLAVFRLQSLQRTDWVRESGRRLGESGGEQDEEGESGGFMLEC